VLGWLRKKIPTRGAAPASEADERFMRRALELARDAAARGETPVGAVVVETATGRVLGEGRNDREGPADPAGHAELIAVRTASRALGDWRLSACTLYVTLEPCPMCAGLVVQARVGRLVYGARDPKAGAVDSLYELCTDARLNHRVSVTGGVLAGESSALLRSFFKELRRGKRAARASHRREAGGGAGDEAL